MNLEQNQGIYMAKLCMGPQALAYEVRDRMRTPLHMPKTETCKKSTSCLTQKALRCAADHMSKTTTFFIFHFL